MASTFKPTYLRPIPANAKRCKLKGEPAVEYMDRRGRHVRPVHRDTDGKLTNRMICAQSRWWMQYHLPSGGVRREKGYTDRQATEQEAARREREAQLTRAGVLSVNEGHLAAPLEEHIIAYVGDLERAGRVPNYYELVGSRLRAMSEGCGWNTLQGITADTLRGYLAGLRRQGYRTKTQNDYGDVAKGFCNWCVENRRLVGNPLGNVKKVASDRDGIGNDKASLSVEQTARLIETSPRHGLLYLVAVRTGLRRSELKALQWRDLFLDGPRPYIQLRASITKARRADRLPLRGDVAAGLRQARPADAKPLDAVFTAIPRMKAFRRDLDAAAIPHFDPVGKPVVFHSLRITFCTQLASTVREPRIAMELMRHTDLKLTAQFYTDPRLLDTAAAVDALPDLDGERKQGQAATKTGTYDRPIETIVSNRVPDSPEQSFSVLNGEANIEKPLKKQGFSNGGGVTGSETIYISRPVISCPVSLVEMHVWRKRKKFDPHRHSDCNQNTRARPDARAWRQPDAHRGHRQGPSLTATSLSPFDCQRLLLSRGLSTVGIVGHYQLTEINPPSNRTCEVLAPAHLAFATQFASGFCLRIPRQARIVTPLLTTQTEFSGGTPWRVSCQCLVNNPG